MADPRRATGRNETPDDAIALRRFTEADLPHVLALLQQSLGWLPDEDHERFFRWKHFENPFGRSPAWVATDGDAVVGFRTFMPWEFDDGGRIFNAVRAVDTATHPRYQGRGIFSRLTLHALEELRADGVEFVFNTPNDKSRPGYLKMGWRQAARLWPRVRLRSLLSLPRVAGARVAAEKWSTSTGVGEPASSILSDLDPVRRLLRSLPSEPGVSSRRSAEYLAWRYRLAPLHYRVAPLGSHVADGLLIFRLRRRGSSLELVVCDALAPDPRAVTSRLRRVLSDTGADYSLALQALDRFVPLPGMGPVLTVRPLAGSEAPRCWRLSMGDIELF